MLILTRQIGQSIMIGDDITITILGNGGRGNQIKVGIDAPKNVSVHREEIFLKVKEEETKGANSGAKSEKSGETYVKNFKSP